MELYMAQYIGKRQKSFKGLLITTGVLATGLGFYLGNAETPVERITNREMFEIIRDKAEEHPELMDFFGPNAHNHMERRFLDKYHGVVDKTFNDISESLKESGYSVIEALRIAKDYIVENVFGD
jgi:hypothetical protein